MKQNPGEHEREVTQMDVEATDARPAGSEGESKLSAVRALWIAVALIGFGAVAAVAVFRNQQGLIDDLEAEVRSLQNRDTVGEINDQLTPGRERLAELESELDRMGEKVDELGSELLQFWTYQDERDSEIRSLARCVNDYMDVVGASGGYEYTYLHC